MLTNGLRSLCVAVAAGVVGGCGGGGDGDDTPAALHPPTISAQPQADTVFTDATATFSVTADGTGLAYQWKKDGVAIAGATAASYTTPPVTWVDSGKTFTVVVSNADGAVTSASATLNLKLSADQQAFETLILAPGSSHQLQWNLNFSGPEVSGTNYAWSDSSSQALSPLTHGPQKTTQTAPVNMAASLALTIPGPTRILKNGTILVVPPSQQSTSASYVGSSIQIDFLAADGTTVAWSQLRSAYATVPLAGVMAGTTDDFAHYHNSFFSNPAILNPASSYLPGAAYVKYTATMKGDRFTAVDCAAATFDANITPCRTGMTLAAAMAAGIASATDARTYVTADGAISTVGGLPMFVATAPRPLSATLSNTTQYRVYFELNGNVYTGVLIKDGNVLGASYWVSNPGAVLVTDRLTFLPFTIRMNKAARDSVAAALAI